MLLLPFKGWKDVDLSSFYAGPQLLSLSWMETHCLHTPVPTGKLLRLPHSPPRMFNDTTCFNGNIQSEQVNMLLHFSE